MRRLAHRVTPVLRVASTALVCACAHGGVTRGASAFDDETARSPAGRWEGVAREPGIAPLRLTITLDSADGAWHG